jgi:nucleoside-diphosphate-sugar epimerase
VYGAGRDEGMTSEPTKAMLAAANGQDYHINFGGRMQFQHAHDVARQLIECALYPLPGAFGFNMGGPITAVSDVAALIMQMRPGVTITVADTALALPIGFDATELAKAYPNVYDMPLAEGVQDTIQRFTRAGA